jgi:cell wall-associated NlpC family hydrolase
MTIPHYPQTDALTPVSRSRSAGRRQLAWWLLVGLLLGGCSSMGSHRSGTMSPRYGEPSATTAVSNEVLMRAISLVGTPYRYGGNTPESGFDCSGLVDFVFLDAAGLRLPRSTRELIELNAPAVRRAQLQPGDLVFFNSDGGKVSHIGIYVGEGRFVHAPSAGGTVRLDMLDTAYWKQSFRSAKRVLH